MSEIYYVMVGIAIEDQPEMFKQFTQFNRNALQGGGGSGLGLWVCKNLATFHGGRLVRTKSFLFMDLNNLRCSYLHRRVSTLRVQGREAHSSLTCHYSRPQKFRLLLLLLPLLLLL